jgi:hypothetical protein
LKCTYGTIGRNFMISRLGRKLAGRGLTTPSRCRRIKLRAPRGIRVDKTGGPNAFFFDSTRRYATQFFLSLQRAWLNLSENPSTGSGGTCFGDSGGPHFLGGVESNLEVALTVTGDAVCRATDKTYRLDTRAARAFLSGYVTLP